MGSGMGESNRFTPEGASVENVIASGGLKFQ
jgi:hypothetical protein